MTLRATCPIYSDDRIVVLGDSITAEYPLADPTNPYNGWYHPYLQGALDPGTVSSAGFGGRDAKPVWLNSGVGGQATVGALADLAALVTDKNPTVVIIELGVNDVDTSVSDANFTTRYQGIVDGIQAVNGSGVRFVMLSILVYGELHTSGAWGANSHDTDIAAKNAIIATIAAAEGQTYVDLRTPLLAWEVANNPANVATGKFCYDAVTGVHPTFPLVNGASTLDARVLMGQWVAPQMVRARR